jgi:PAS domain S-box-containing protein
VKQSELLIARRLASIVESSEVAIVGKRLDGTIETWNAAAAEHLFGYTAAEAVGRHISLVIPPERIAEEDHIIATLRQGRRIEHFETERVRSDGRRVVVSLSVSPIKDDTGVVIGASKMARDVTRERQAEAESNRLITLIENSRDFIGIYGLDGTPIFVNQPGSSWWASTTSRPHSVSARGTSFFRRIRRECATSSFPQLGRRDTPRSKFGFAISEPAPRAGWRTSCSRCATRAASRSRSAP